MKYIIIIALVVLAIFFISQVWAKNETDKTEMHKYEVLEKFDGFEVRKYESAKFTYVKMNVQSYKESSSMGFRTLAGYIFGGNEDNMSIAMTSPVTMSMEDSVTMKFMVPSEYELDDLPRPMDSNVKFSEEPEKIVAAIAFGGWASDERISKYSEKLKMLLAENNIKHSNSFSYLGYNPPFEVLNRRNEVIVEVYYSQN
ncbi:MAG: heme-binding protein [Bacteroidia bacterium]|nr:heme-binding protein [Bacteroidia bacterium]NNC86049.1 heme-binding protein [Bacteroidia bacterium]NNM15592.1 heme-binding protein [Bacteroidia bacterium]